MRLSAAAVVFAIACAWPLAANGQEVPCVDGEAGVFACENVDLLSHISLVDFDSDSGSGHWGWTDPETGREYALMGLSDATAFVDITDPVRPVFIGKLPAQTDPSMWREMKTYGPYALIVSEAPGHGMQIFDLRRLADISEAEMPTTFEADAVYDLVGHAHNVAVDEQSRHAFIVGNREEMGCAGGLHIVEMSDPLNPAFAGCFADDGYTHDVQCLTYAGPDDRYRDREICLASNEDTLTIVDVTEKDAPVMLSQGIYPFTGYTHQGWLTEDQRYFVLNDEFDEMRYGLNTRTIIFDVSDLERPEFIGDHLGPTRAVAHNLYVRGDVVYMANYRRGLEVATLVDPAEASMTNIAFFDTFPENNDPLFGGAWNVYPFYESGTVTIADMNRGLFMVRPRREEALELARTHTLALASGLELHWSIDRDDLEHFFVERIDTEEPEPVGVLRRRAGHTSHTILLDVPTDVTAVRLRAVDRSGMTHFSEPILLEPILQSH